MLRQDREGIRSKGDAHGFGGGLSAVRIVVLWHVDECVVGLEQDLIGSRSLAGPVRLTVLQCHDAPDLPALRTEVAQDPIADLEP